MPIIEDLEKSLSGLIDFLSENDIPFEIIDEDDVGIFSDEVAEEKEPEEDQWYEYFTTLGEGYSHGDKLEGVTQIYYSQSRDDADFAESRIVDDFGRRWVGLGSEIFGNANQPREVDWDEVDEDNIL